MKVLKGYTNNQYRLEASIVERYVTKEAIEFCLEYIQTTTPVGLPKSHHDCTRGGGGTQGFNVVTMNHQQLSQAHLYILNNTTEVISYIDTHKQNLTVTHPKMNIMKVLQEHNRTFINWYRETTLVDDNASKILRLLVVGPNLNVPT